MYYKPVTHVIFDLDGLLLDSERGYDAIITNIARQYGKEYTVETRMRLLGTKEDDTVRLAVELMGLPITPEEFRKMYKASVLKEMGNVPLLDGAERLILHLKKHNVPMAIATSGSREATERKLEIHEDLFSHIGHKVMGSSDPDVKNGKPAPDIFLVCASRFADKPSPEKCLVFEDAPNGVKGAIAAGMQTIMVPSDETSEELRKEATLILDTLRDFKPELFGLPPLDK